MGLRHPVWVTGRKRDMRIHICVIRRVHMCDRTHSHAWHACSLRSHVLQDAFTCVASAFASVWCAVFTCVAGRIHMRDMRVHISVTWHIHKCDRMHLHVWHETFICVTGRNHMHDLRIHTHSHTWHVHSYARHAHSYVQLTYSYVSLWFLCSSCTDTADVRDDAFICVTWQIHMCDMTYSYLKYDIFSLTRLQICTTPRLFLRVSWRIRTCKPALSYAYVCECVYTVWACVLVYVSCGESGQTYKSAALSWTCNFVAYVCGDAYSWHNAFKSKIQYYNIY